MQANEINVLIFWACAIVGLIVYAIIIWSLLIYRKSGKSEASFHKSTVTEIAWTVVPLLIIIAMTIPAAKVLTRLYSESSSDGNSSGKDNGGLNEAQFFPETDTELRLPIELLPALAESNSVTNQTMKEDDKYS